MWFKSCNYGFFFFKCVGTFPPFFCRSFENNWNIYKILAFQKPVKTEVAAHTVLPPSWMKKQQHFFGLWLYFTSSDQLLLGHSQRGSPGWRHELCRQVCGQAGTHTRAQGLRRSWRLPRTRQRTSESFVFLFNVFDCGRFYTERKLPTLLLCAGF